MTEKIMLPMAETACRQYAVTLSEQNDLARRFGLSIDDVRIKLSKLSDQLSVGVVQPQKTGNKTKAIIEAHFRQQ